MVSLLSLTRTLDATSPSQLSNVNAIHGTYSQLIAWLILVIWPSHLGIPVLVATILFSKKVQRHPTLVNMCIIWIIIGLSCSILLYSGYQTGPEPPKPLCLFQASLLCSMPVTASLSAFSLVFQMFTTIRYSVQSRGTESDGTWRKWLMLAGPYFALLVIALSTAMVGASDSSRISRDRRFFYCSVRSHGLSHTVALIGSAILISTLVLECWTVVLMYKRSTYFRGNGSQLRGSAEASLTFRVIAFGFYLIIGLSMSLISIAHASPVPDLVIATCPSAVIFIFGTQPDIRRALCFWRKEEVDLQTISRTIPQNTLEQRHSHKGVVPLVVDR